MLSQFRRLCREEEGQTLVLGAIGMLILAVAVLSTLNIGNAAYEKIRLQNTADSAAYSLAATQARVFNFQAYTNRAIICHYNSMLTIMAYLSYAIYVKNTIGRLMSVLKFLPYIGTVAAIIEKIINYTVKVLKIFAKLAIPALGAVNWIYFAMQALMALIGMAAVATQPDVVQENDPKAKTEIDFSNLGMGSVIPAMAKASNLYSAYRAIDLKRMAQLMPNSNDWQKIQEPAPEGNEARYVMSELINNARHEWVASSKDGIPFIGRRWDLGPIIVPGVGGLSKIDLYKKARTEHGILPDGFVKKHDQIYSVETFKIYVKSYIFGYWYELIYRSIAAADYQKGFLLEALDKREKRCCRLCARCKLGKATVKPFMEPIRLIIDAALDARGKQDKDFKHLGVVPFLKFDPSPKWRQAFNQPVFMIVANKDDETLNTNASGNAQPYQMKVAVDFGVSVQNSALETERGKDSEIDFAFDNVSDGFLSGLVNGMNAIAVAKTYYHRPGEWREHPNFFNPFWGAKLQPVAHHPFLGQVPHLSNFTDEIITH